MSQTWEYPFNANSWLSACEHWTRAVCHLLKEVEGINLRISIPTMSRDIIYSLRSCFRIEEANYDGSCRRIMAVFYGSAPHSLTFYSNILYWGDSRFYWGPNNKIWQTNRTTGDTTRFHSTVNRIVDIGIVAEGKMVIYKQLFQLIRTSKLN